MAEKPVQRNAFVIRIWQEEGSPWQGWVQHARSKKARCVRSLPELVAFIQEWTGQLTGDGAPEAE